jgi:hypothetical protein
MDDTKLSALPGHGRASPAAVDAPTSWQSRGTVARRHEAISRQLLSYSQYKSWAERTRAAWQREDEQASDNAVLRTR